jgi:chaperonin cofactor prefoldin
MEEDAEKLTMEYQKVQSRMQALAIQKAQLAAEKEEYKKALEEVEKSTGKVYTSRGNAMIETTKEESIKAIKEEQDSVDLKISIVDKQYNDTSKKEQELRERINAIIKEQGGQAQ